MAPAYRVCLILAVTIGIVSLAEGLTMVIIASKLLAAHTPKAAHDASAAQVESWFAFAISVASFVAFAFLFFRGSRSGVVAEKGSDLHI
jgi:hypothetical protein